MNTGTVTLTVAQVSKIVEMTGGEGRIETMTVKQAPPPCGFCQKQAVISFVVGGRDSAEYIRGCAEHIDNAIRLTQTSSDYEDGQVEMYAYQTE